MLARCPRRSDFQTALTEFEAARTIDDTLTAAIADALAPLNPEFWSIAVRVFHEDDGAVSLLVAPQEARNLTPEWTKDPKVRGAIKQAVWKTVSEAAPALLPVGDLHYLMEEASGYYWDGATTDEEALEALESMGYDAADVILPSHLNKAIPRWINAKYKSKRKLPRAISNAISLVKRRLRAFKKMPARHSAWQQNYEITIAHDASYEDTSSTPPFFLVPLAQPILDILDIVADGAMQVGFFDVVGATTLRKPSEINAWLDSLAAGAKLLAAIDALLDALPYRTANA